VDSPELIKQKIMAPNSYLYFPGGFPWANITYNKKTRNTRCFIRNR
jgi:hypothetical protein